MTAREEYETAMKQCLKDLESIKDVSVNGKSQINHMTHMLQQLSFTLEETILPNMQKMLFDNQLKNSEFEQFMQTQKELCKIILYKSKFIHQKTSQGSSPNQVKDILKKLVEDTADMLQKLGEFVDQAQHTNIEKKPIIVENYFSNSDQENTFFGPSPEKPQSEEEQKPFPPTVSKKS